jgi:hypothetical protein
VLVAVPEVPVDVPVPVLVTVAEVPVDVPVPVIVTVAEVPVDVLVPVIVTVPDVPVPVAVDVAPDSVALGKYEKLETAMLVQSPLESNVKEIDEIGSMLCTAAAWSELLQMQDLYVPLESLA